MLNLANVAFLIRLGLRLAQDLLDRCDGVLLIDGNSNLIDHDNTIWIIVDIRD